MPRPPTPAVPPPPEGERRYRMVVAYDGASYHGFAPNPGVPTVGGTLGQSMRRVLGYEPVLTCAGRTDAGVHGWGQVVSFDAAPFDPPALQRSLNGLCGPTLVVRSLEAVSDDFDARFSAQSRTYRYRVLRRSVPDPFLAQTTWHVADELDVAAMNRAGDVLLGEHDFSSFCRRKRVQVGDRMLDASLVREVLSLRWQPVAPRHPDDPDGDLLELWISATAFCHQMVRSIAGTLVDVGRSRVAVDAMPAILEARDRAAAGTVAPPQGLTLWSVSYDSSHASPRPVT